MYRSGTFLFIIFLLIFSFQKVNASPGIETGFLFPANDASSIERNIGKKGIELLFFPEDGIPDTEFPLDISMSSVRVRIIITPMSGSPSTVDCNKGDLDPPPGEGGYNAIDGLYITDGVDDTIGIIYNGIFPPEANIQIEVKDVKENGAGGAVQNPNPITWSFTTKSAPPRDPVSIALVLDRSGSMDRPTSGGGPKKIDVLKKAVEIFFNTIMPYTIPEDKIGVVFFDQDAIPKPLSSGDPILVDINEDNIIALKDIVNDESASGSTSIGDGLLASDSEGFNRVSNPREIVVLFTDGKQNSAEMVNEDDTFDDSTRNLNIGGNPFSTDYDICVISVGLSNAARYEFNNTISQKRCGEPGMTFNAFEVDDLSSLPKQTELIGHFTTILENAVVGDKLEKSKIIQGSIGSGETKTESFMVSQRDNRLSIILTWSNPRIKRLNAILRSPSPDRVEIDPISFTRFGRQSSVISFRLPSITNNQVVPHKGVWELVINPTGNLDFVSDYNAIVMVDNTTIETEYSFDGIDFGTGETIPIQVKLKEGGSPVTGATVIVQVTSPDEGVGNILSQNPTPQEGPPPNTSGDALSLVEQKLAALLNDPSLRAQLLQSNRPSVVLKDEEGDGIYTGEYTNTLKEGIYNFTFLIEGSTPDNSDFARTQKLNLHVRTKPSPSTTEVTAEVIARGPGNSGTVLIKFIPFDALKNYLGPGYTNFIRVATTQGTLIGNIVDKLDGSYEQRIQLADLSQDPTITMSVRDAKVLNAPLSKLMKSNPQLWWIILIIFLIILFIFIIWLIFFK